MKKSLTLIFASSIFLTACGQQNWYQGARSAQAANCMKQPLAEYEDCNQSSQDMSYQQYEKMQEQLQSEDKDSSTME